MVAVVAGADPERHAKNIPDGGGSGRSRSGKACEKHRGKNRNHAKSAGDMPHHAVGHLHQARRKSAMGHQIAGQDKARYCQQGKRLSSGNNPLRHYHQIDVQQQQRGNGGKADGKRNRHADRQQKQKSHGQNPRS
jgi:hypothetical protein